jgi:serine/threonine protein phosphatase PrpC
VTLPGIDGPLVLECGQCLDKGRSRTEQQDSLLVMKGPQANSWLLVVADGVGGLPGGAAASETVVAAIEAAVRECAGVLADCAAAGIATGNSAIVARDAETGITSGSTVAAVAIENGTAQTLHAGDSRAYLMRDGGLVQLTQDHSVVGEAVRDGRLSAEEARVHPQRNAITRALGVGEQIDVERSAPRPLLRGDLLLVCSDGLHGLVDSDEIAAFLGQEGTADERAASLVAAANRAGGSDNIAVVVAIVR